LILLDLSAFFMFLGAGLGLSANRFSCPTELAPRSGFLFVFLLLGFSSPVQGFFLLLVFFALVVVDLGSLIKIPFLGMRFPPRDEFFCLRARFLP
jgi:hypothetical protein